MSFETDNIVLTKDKLGLLRARHKKVVRADYWNSLNLPDHFWKALEYRRRIQATQVCDRFEKELIPAVPVVDYACGSGNFVAELNRRGFDSVGCDLSRSPHLKIPKFILLNAEWELPKIEFRTLILNDVLEHCEDPERFVTRIREAGARQLLIKVPNRYGPLFLIAEILAKFGRVRLIETLFLVGEPHPHLYYFSPAYLVDMLVRAGWEVQDVLFIPEVGAEVVERTAREGKRGFFKFPMRVFGAAIAMMAYLGWSDTFVVRASCDAAAP